MVVQQTNKKNNGKHELVHSTQIYTHFNTKLAENNLQNATSIISLSKQTFGLENSCINSIN